MSSSAISRRPMSLPTSASPAFINGLKMFANCSRRFENWKMRKQSMSLKKNEIAQFKKRLEQMRASVIRAVQGTKEAVTQPDEAKGYSQHSADEGTDDF